MILFNVAFTCIIVIACNLLVIELNNQLNMEIIVAMVDLCVMLGITFAYFYLSEWITSDLFEIGDIFYNAPWSRLPIKQQKLFVLLPIQRAERGLRLKCLGLFECSLAVFWMVSPII